MNRIEAVIFDLDGVITDTAVYHYAAWKQLANSIGIEIDEAFNETLKGVSRMDSLERILEYGHKENHYTDEEKKMMASTKNCNYQSLISEIKPEDIHDGIVPFINELKDNGCKIGLASASKNARSILDGLKLTGEFDYIADAAKVARSKPAPDIFLDAIKGLGVDKSKCIGIEDAHAGVEAINAAQLFSVGIGSSEVLNNADVVFGSTKELTYSNVLEVL